VVADHKVIDITHESLIRQWQEFQAWLAEEQQDVTELKEWRERAARRLSGGGFLDENDHARAQKWLKRVAVRASNPGLWAQRYASDASVSFEEVQRFISDSGAKLKADRAELEHLEREAREARIRQLELENKIQIEAKQKAEEDKRRAEEEKRNAEAFAQESRRKTRMALAALCAAILALIGVFFFASRVERLARDAALSGLFAEAQRLESSQPDSSILLSLFVRRNTSPPEVDGFTRYLRSQLNFLRVFRGHEREVSSPSFSPDGKTLVTASGDRTARLWRCDICRPVEEIVQELKTAIGRHFTADECQWFGISDELLRSAGLSKDEYCVDSSKSTGEGF
jgi:hypothetical protein